MEIKTFLHKILFTFTAVDRASLNPSIEARMSADVIGSGLYTAMIFGFVFSLLNLAFWIPNTYLFHLQEQPVKITMVIITGMLIGPFTKIASSEPYKQFVKDHYFDSKYPTMKWYLLSYGLHVLSTIMFVITFFI